MISILLPRRDLPILCYELEGLFKTFSATAMHDKERALEKLIKGLSMT